MMALAEDHRNDVISNLAAIACGGVASSSRKLWYIDPIGGILASIYIIYSWALICKAQVLVRYNLKTLTIPCMRLRPFATAERMGTKYTNILHA